MKLLKGLNECVDVLCVISDGDIFCVLVLELGDESGEVYSLDIVGVVARFSELKYSFVYPNWEGF